MNTEPSSQPSLGGTGHGPWVFTLQGKTVNQLTQLMHTGHLRVAQGSTGSGGPKHIMEWVAVGLVLKDTQMFFRHRRWRRASQKGRSGKMDNHGPQLGGSGGQGLNSEHEKGCVYIHASGGDEGDLLASDYKTVLAKYLPHQLQAGVGQIHLCCYHFSSLESGK